MNISRRQIIGAGAFGLLAPHQLLANPATNALKLVRAARSQIGVTTVYDGRYEKLAYPGGDVPRGYGVCTDVIIRAYRDGLSLDLQQLIHQDMKSNFSAYPKNWGLRTTDRNIDHRRVPNMRTFWKRQNAVKQASTRAEDWRAGDIITSIIGGKLAHCGIVSDRKTGNRPLVIHNVGSGTREEDRLFAYPITGRYRWSV